MINWKLEVRKISSLRDYYKNPRTLTKDQEFHLSTSIKKFGLIDKPIINTDGTLIGGHQRKRVLKKLGLKEVECYVPDRKLTEKEIEELNIRLNKNTGDFDFDILANQFEIHDLVEWGFALNELDVSVEAEKPASQEAEEELNICPTCGQKTSKDLDELTQDSDS